MAFPLTVSSGRPVAIAQGSYWILTGLWPVVHLASFEWVTGPKTDDWLVRTIGALIAAVGVTLTVAARNDRIGADAARLALLGALALGVADILAPLLAGVRWIYLLDAPVQATFALYWAWYLARGRPGEARPRAAGPEPKRARSAP